MRRGWEKGGKGKQSEGIMEGRGEERGRKWRVELLRRILKYQETKTILQHFIICKWLKHQGLQD